jgi:hypothetical protein
MPILKNSFSMYPSWSGGERRKESHAHLSSMHASHAQRSYSQLSNVADIRSPKQHDRSFSVSKVSAFVTGGE